MARKNNHLPSEQAGIRAGSVTLEVVDSRTGGTFKRTLPLEYAESANGIVLTGEDMSGKTVSIVFLSDAAALRLDDLTGKGPDRPAHHDAEDHHHD